MSVTPDISALLHRIERLEAVEKIQQIMGRRAYLHSAGRHDREIEELWSKREDLVFEAEDWGAWTSRKSIVDSYVKGNPFPPTTKGLMIEHTITTPVIEVAENGQTAKGVWISPGHETFPIGGKMRPHWSWGRYAVDFCKDGDEWKIWHLHVLTTFRTPYDRDWADSAVNRPDYLPKEGETMETVGSADRGVSFNQPYHPDVTAKYQPVPPDPYTSWKDTFSATDYYEHPAQRSS